MKEEIGSSSFLKKRTKKLLLLVLTATTAGCQLAECPVGLARMKAVDLYFGRNIQAHGEVSEGQWADFLARAITPEFPNGFTVFAAQGQWMNSRTGMIEHEKTWMVRAVLPADTDIASHTNPITSLYRQRFHQQSVGVTVTPLCASF